MIILAVILLATVATSVNADAEIDNSKNNWKRLKNTDSFKETDEDDSGIDVSHHDHVRSQIENEEEKLNYITYVKDKKNIIRKSKQINKLRSKKQYAGEELNENANYNEIRTTCEEFAENSYFHPKEIFYKKWESFYKWTTHVPNKYVTTFNFTIPKRKVTKS